MSADKENPLAIIANALAAHTESIRVMAGTLSALSERVKQLEEALADER